MFPFKTLSRPLFGLILFTSAAFTQNNAWYIDTLAGTDRPLNDGGPATSALLNSPAGVVVDANGNVIIADAENHRLRKVSPTGTISTIAGTGVAGYSGDSGLAVSAQIDKPEGLAIDSDGNIYFSDYIENVIRKITPDGVISTVAGTGFPDNSGDNGPATKASLNGPYGIAFDLKGNLLVSDYFNNAIRSITPTGTISHFATVQGPTGIAPDKFGNVFVSAYSLDEIVKVSATGTVTVVAGASGTGFSGDGGPASSAKLNSPAGLSYDKNQNLWIADAGNNRIRVIDALGNIKTVAGSGNPGHNFPAADLTQLGINQPDGIFTDRSGVYWAEKGNHKIRRYNADNTVTEIAGSWPPLTASGPPTSLLLFNPFSAAADSAGNLFISDSSNNVIRKITPDGASSIFAGTGDPGYNADTGAATVVKLNYPAGVAIDATGNLLIADSGNGLVRRVTPAGALTTVAGGGNFLPVTGTPARQAFLIAPTGIAADPSNGFYLTDQLFQIALAVDVGSTISLFATSSVNYLSLPTGIAVDAAGTTYIADTYNHRVLKRTRFGNSLTVLAGTGAPGFSGDGGPANQAHLFLPYGVAVDSSNNVYIADSGNYRIRQVDPSGNIKTIAGTGLSGFSGDKSIAALAQLGFVTGLSLDPSGNIIVADSSNQRIRRLKYQQVVPDLSISLDSNSKTVNVGDTLTVAISLNSTTGLATPVALSVSGQPDGWNIQFTPSTATVTPGKTFVIAATAQIPANAVGPVTLKFTATAGSLVKTANLAVTIVNAPTFTSAGVVSAASFAGGGVSPGEIIAIFGQQLGPATLAAGVPDANNFFPTSIAGTQVTFDGISAPLIFTAAGQIAAIVPYAIGNRSTTQMQVQYNGQSSSLVSLNVLEAAPALFTAGGSQAAALNQDGSVNSSSNPARAGTEIVLFGTGEGLTTPAGVDGKVATTVFPAPALKVTVTIGGEPAIVDYAGAAPFEVAGVLQINARIPGDLKSGSAPVVVTVGTHASTGNAAIAIQ